MKGISNISTEIQFLLLQDKMTSLAEYVSRMKDKQEMIFYVAGNSRGEVTILVFFFWFKIWRR